MVYRWRDGYRASVNAQVAGERLAEIREENGGHLTPADVVEDARPEDAPLHPEFTWDDEVAAENWRQDEARRLIRSVEVVVETHAPGEQPKATIGYVHVDLPDDGPVYVTSARAMSEPELREQVLADAISAFEALRRRYEHLAELADVFAAIDRTRRNRRRRDDDRRLPPEARP
jgi:hypothetical protein